MTVIEFIEAIGRLAAKVSCGIPYDYMQYMYEEMCEDNPELKARMPLHFRIECLLVQMIKATLTKDFKGKLFTEMNAKYKAEYNAPKRTKYAHVGGPY